MAAKKKSARQKSKHGKKADKKAEKKSAKKSRAAKRAAKAARKPVKPVTRKPVKAAKPAKLAKPPKLAKPVAQKAATVKSAAPAKKPAAGKLGTLRVVAGSAKPAPAAKKVVVLKGLSRPAVVKSPTGAPAARDKPRVRTANSDYMNARQIEVFRKLLLDWKRSLMEEVDRTVHHMQDEASNFPDPNDRATQEEEFALELRTRDRERKLIKKIDEALVSLDGGDYGYCEICGVEIGIKRLEARPTATLCIDCKNLEEIKERQYG